MNLDRGLNDGEVIRIYWDGTCVVQLASGYWIGFMSKEEFDMDEDIGFQASEADVVRRAMRSMIYHEIWA